MSTQDLLTIIFGAGVTTAFVSGLVQLLLWRLNRKATVDDRKDEASKTVKDALCLLLHDKIKFLGTKYIDQEYVRPDDLQLLIEMYECYHTELGGDGLLDSIMKQVNALRIRK